MDMKLLIKASLLIVSGLAVLTAQAATVVPDGRGNGMGNAGVTTADYVLAPFYNPALVAVYRDSDSFGILFPGIGARIRDTDKTLETVDDLQDVIKQYEANSSTSGLEAQINSYLDQLSDDKPLGVNGGVIASVALPLDAFSTNLFLRGYADVIAKTDISSDGNTQTRYENSRVDMIAFGYSEFGVAIAKEALQQAQHA